MRRQDFPNQIDSVSKTYYSFPRLFWISPSALTERWGTNPEISTEDNRNQRHPCSACLMKFWKRASGGPELEEQIQQKTLSSGV
jgi:hypothetical protein